MGIKTAVRQIVDEGKDQVVERIETIIGAGGSLNRGAGVDVLRIADDIVGDTKAVAESRLAGSRNVLVHTKSDNLTLGLHVILSHFGSPFYKSGSVSYIIHYRAKLVNITSRKILHKHYLFLFACFGNLKQIPQFCCENALIFRLREFL
jgi:hypothetical protein